MAITPFRMAVWHFTNTSQGNITVDVRVWVKVPLWCYGKLSFIYDFVQILCNLAPNESDTISIAHTNIHLHVVRCRPSELRCLIPETKLNCGWWGIISAEATLHSAARINLGHHRAGSLSWNTSIFRKGLWV